MDDKGNSKLNSVINGVKNVNMSSTETAVKEAGRVAATVYGGKLGRFAYDAAAKTKLGQNVINGVSNNVNNTLNRNPFIKPLYGVINKQNNSNNNSLNFKNSDLDYQDNLEKESSTKTEENQEENKTASFSLFNNKGKYGKLKLYLMIGSAGFVLFIIIFIIVFLDVTMNKYLNVLNWNIFSSDNSTSVDSSSDFSSDEANVIQNDTLVALIGEDGIIKIEEDIKNSASESCSGDSVAKVVISLMDGLNNHKLKVPYQNGGRVDAGVVINRNWGTRMDNSTQITEGLDNVGLLIWAYNNSNVNNQISSISDLSNYGLYENVDNLKPGDLLVGTSDVKIVLQNTGSTIKISDVTSDGLEYKELYYNNISGYDYKDMSSYYTSYCQLNSN